MQKQSNQFSPRITITPKPVWLEANSSWINWWDKIECGCHEVNKQLIDFLEIKLGDHVLDLSVTMSDSSAELARRVGPKGQVNVVKIAPHDLTYAKKEDVSYQLSHLDFIEQKDIEYPEFAFNSILCRWGLMQFNDVDQALRRFYKMLAPAGKFAAVIWDELHKVPFIYSPFQSASKVVDHDITSLFEIDTFKISQPNAIVEHMSNAGFTDIYMEQRDVVLEWPDSHSFVNFLRINCRHTAWALSHPEILQRSELWAKIESDLSSHIDKITGKVSMNNSAICVVGSRYEN